MAYITIYDATATDKEQLSALLKGTDHYWEFIDESISLENLRPNSEVISVFVTSNVTRAIIEKLPNLRLIACRSTGFNNIDLSAAEEHKIVVSNVPSYGEHTVAEYAFALILNLSRHLHASIDAASSPIIDLTTLTGFDLNHKTLGIIGMGRIGQRVAQIAHGFDMRVLAYDPFPSDDKAKEFGFEYADLETIAKESDVLTLHAPYTKDNHHLINAAFLKNVKPSAVLVNTSRGELVDTTAIISAVKDKRLSGVALDVIEGEELLNIEDEEALLLGHTSVPANLLTASLEINILMKLPNVIITPHNAFNTIEAIGRINQTAAKNMINFWYGDTPDKVSVPPVSMGKLLIIRHGESEWNALGKWTGSTDVHLSERGFHQAAQLGLLLKEIPVDFTFCSQQIRALETMESIFDASQQFDIPYERDAAINERDYGDYTGMNKWEVRDKIGEEAFNHLRRDWDYAVPGGETLKMVYERVIPFYLDHMLPKLKEGKTVLMVSHGNAIRALMKYIESISDDGVANLEMPIGNVVIYEINETGKQLSRSILETDAVAPLA